MSEFDCPDCQARLFRCQRCNRILCVEDGVADDSGEAAYCIECARCPACAADLLLTEEAE